MRVYTDGSCTRSGSGGWAWVVSPEGSVSGSGAEEGTTNQRMEMMAVLRALEAFPNEEFTIVSDSRYVIDCFHQKWWVKWMKNGWKNASGNDVANQDLWLSLLEQTRYRTIEFEWVKGHAEDPMNALADRLAGAARKGVAVAESKDKFELACNAMYQWWKSAQSGDPIPPEVTEQVRQFLLKMKLIEG